MSGVVDYFTDMPSWHRAVLLLAGFFGFFALGVLWPMARAPYDRSKHTLTSFFFTATTGIVNLPLVVVLIAISDWAADTGFGVVQWVNGPPLVDLIVGMLVLDFFAAWFAHRTLHRVALGWRFHLIHHIDQHIDATSANRHHPGESVIRFAFTSLGALAAGAPIWVAVAYQSTSALMSQFNHSNIAMPKRLDDVLQLVICTPNMHRVHHHHRQPYSDANYGNIFSFWDRLLGTHMVADNTALQYGVDSWPDAAMSDSIVDLLKVPFEPYRNAPTWEAPEVLPR